MKSKARLMRFGTTGCGGDDERVPGAPGPMAAKPSRYCIGDGPLQPPALSCPSRHISPASPPARIIMPKHSTRRRPARDKAGDLDNLNLVGTCNVFRCTEVLWCMTNMQRLTGGSGNGG